MKEEIIDRIFDEELAKFGLQDRGWTWRHGYPKSYPDGLIASSYVDFEPEKNFRRVTIDETLRTTIAVRKDIRHELCHALYNEHGTFCGEFFPTLCEYLPIEKYLIKRLNGKK